MVYCSNVLVATPLVQKLCNPDTWETNWSFQVLQEYHNVGIFALLACYAALIGSCRRFGTNYRSLLLPDPWWRDIQPVPKRHQLFNSICNSSNSNAWISSHPPPFNDSLLHSMTHLHRNANNEAPLYTTFPQPPFISSLSVPIFSPAYCSQTLPPSSIFFA